MIPVLDVRGLLLTTPGAVRLGPLDLTLAAGAQLAILGPEGCGKSLLLRLLAGLAAPAAGELLLAGEPMADLQGRARADLLGVLFQEADRQWLMPVVWDEVALGPRRQGLTGPALTQRVERALTQAEVAPPLHHGAMATLSPSRRCRVAVAALLASRPRLILADEPGSLLSQEGETDLARLLSNYCKEENAGLVIFTSRRERAKRFAPTLLMLDQGVLAPDSEPTERSAS